MAQQRPIYDPATLLPKSEVMVLGTFHFGNPGRDLLNPSVNGILEKRRQSEIVEIVDSLAKWNPTKICIEGDHNSNVFQERLDGYLKGTVELRADERDQIGLRLAKQLSLKAVYPVDVPSDMDFESVMKLAEKTGQSALIETLLAETGKHLNSIFSPEIAERASLAEILASLNTSVADELSHSFYLRLIPITDGQSYPGADLLGEWYKRNLKIATNLFKLIEQPNERILLIIGSGHAKIIRDAVRDMPNVENIDPVPYLLGSLDQCVTN